MTTDALCHVAFYRLITLDDPDAVAARLRELTRALLGSIVVASEGVNGAVAGSGAAIAEFQSALMHDALLGRCLVGMVFKPSACTTEPFGRMKVHRRPELVAVGVPTAISETGTERTPTQVSPAEWRTLIREDDVIVLDNRNSFEFRLGHFNGAVDPGVSHFRDFPAFIENHAAAWREQGTRVAMYCTGGIRCEKTSGWVQSLGLQVFELEGGILNYFQCLPDADLDWQGECFVFDNRVALDTRLQETSTTPEQVYQGELAGEWRLQRARRLADALGATPTPTPTPTTTPAITATSPAPTA